MDEERIVKLGRSMLNELYLKSTPKITFDKIEKKYAGTNVRFWEKHIIPCKVGEKILQKYLKKCKNKFEEDSLRWAWLDYGPKEKCSTCFGYGLWAIGDPSPMGEMDCHDGCPTKKCPECNANPNPIKKVEK